MTKFLSPTSGPRRSRVLTKSLAQSNGQFSGAIAESGIRDPYDPLAASLAENYKTLDYRLQEGIDFLKDRNASNINDLRTKQKLYWVSQCSAMIVLTNA
jgi:hypothetical protein